MDERHGRTATSTIDPITMRTIAVLALAVVAAACGISAQPPPPAYSPGPEPGGEMQATVPVQLIIVFRGGSDPGNPTFLAELSRDIGTPLAYIRPLSGGAHLLGGSVPPATVAELVRLLGNRPDVVDVQLDIAVRRQ